MAGLLDLAQRLEARVAKFESAASDLAINAALAILQDLVVVTPVDTSTALSNWQINLGSRANRFLPAYSYGVKGSTYVASAEATLAAGRAVLANKQPGQPIFISNVTPYIGELNAGSSRQQPAGFVERALIVGRKAAKDLAGVRRI